MEYKSGEKVNVGDPVSIENGRTPGNVKEVIETEQQMKDSGVTEQGVMISSKLFGLVFWPSSLEDDPVIYKGKKHNNAIVQTAKLYAF
jgi:hypothetical protein